MNWLFVGGPRFARSGGLVALLLLVAAGDLAAQGPPPRRPPVGGGNLNNPPAVTTLSVAQLPNKQFQISGTVTDETPGGCTVTISGAASGTVSVASNGQFSGTFNVPSLGAISAVANDGTQNGSASTTNLTNAAPTITGLAAVAGNNNSWTISGTVSDEAAYGLTVTLTGLPNGTEVATCGAGGSFSITVTIPANTSGQVTATVTDWYGSSGSANTNFGS